MVMGSEALWLYDPSTPITAAAMEQEKEGHQEDGLRVLRYEADGLVVVSQSCDIVRDWDERPTVLVAPLTLVTGQDLEKIRRLEKPSKVYIPGIAAQSLVGDLDGIFPVEKALLATWKRVAGCPTLEDQRRFAKCLDRYFSRPAYPDDFKDLVGKLEAWMRDKHDGNGAGEFLRMIDRVLVHAETPWDGPSVQLCFFLIPSLRATVEEDLARAVEAFEKKLGAVGRYLKPKVQIQGLDAMPASLFLVAQPLDVEYLSGRPKRG